MSQAHRFYVKETTNDIIIFTSQTINYFDNDILKLLL